MTNKTARMQVWDETAQQWTWIALPRHEFEQDPEYSNLRRWCRKCRELYDERWSPGHDIHQVVQP